MTPETYANNLIPLALRLVAAVHDEGPDAISGALTAIAALPTPNGTDPNLALTVTLAAMIDPTKSATQLLDWTRNLAGALPTDLEPTGNPLAIEMGLAGVLPAHALTDPEAAEVVRILVERGWAQNVIRDHMQAENKDVIRWAGTARQRIRRGVA